MVDELVRCGVSDIVLGVGSRSAPLALAAAAAEERGEVRVHVRVDERVAGFLALGLGKATGVPAAVDHHLGNCCGESSPCNSGSARIPRAPVIAITADRPPRLRGVGANQTIDQVKVFSSFTRLDIDMETAAPDDEQNAYWRSTISRCVAVATDSIDPGPVHVNAPFDAPLVGSAVLAPLPSELHGRVPMRNRGRPMPDSSRV
jgi:2-succinyl-5-enolpyruvyl-6-hydroxy-3-cyclohexene-1-carboxylate synthase